MKNNGLIKLNNLLSSKDFEKRIQDSVKKSLLEQGVLASDKTLLDESYVAVPQSYELKTEFLSDRAKGSHYDIYQKHVKHFNEISSKLDTVNKDYKEVNSDNSAFRSLKLDEMHNLNAIKLHELYFGNISDLASEITMDTISFIRLQRDWGDFDAWQRDFIACGLASRDGWVVTGYDSYIGKYINFFVDADDANIPIGCLPVLVLDVHLHAYYKDYLEDKTSYIFAMMKELRWNIVEARMMVVEKSGIGAVLTPPGGLKQTTIPVVPTNVEKPENVNPQINTGNIERV